jgi:hypothetical protein
MIILVIGTLWYVSADREMVEKEQNLAYRKEKGLSFKDDDNEQLLEEEVEASMADDVLLVH